MESIRKRFEEFNQPGYASRATANHILDLYIGTDEMSRQMIEFRGFFKPRKISSTASIAVEHFTRPAYITLRFTLLDEEISGLFYVFCEDLIEQTRNLPDATMGYKAITNRFFQWKQMFTGSKKKKLTEFEIMGLIGELLFLKDWLFPRIGIQEALQSWSGQELTHKDFSVGDSWYEIKAISRGNQTVRISSLEQLESLTDGELVVVPLEKMSEEYNGITLNKLYVAICNMITDDDVRDSFIKKITFQGYEYSNFYDSFVYVADTARRYKVTEGFPRLVRSHVPKSIANCVYDILLRDLEPFAIKEDK